MSRTEQALNPAPYGGLPGYKVGGTSKDAAIAIGNTEAIRLQILDMLPRTADEIASAIGRSILYIRPRLSELVADGRARKTQARRKNESGLSAAVYARAN